FVDPCAMGNDCEHICVSSGSSYHCKCRKGYILNEDQKTCSLKRKSLGRHGCDIILHEIIPGVDSCEMGHSCQHICVGNGTSYYCKCRPGYVLNVDKRTCSIANDGAGNERTDGIDNGHNDGESSASVDACALGHNCQHTCVGSGSSYYCTCPPGFVLMEDKRSCFKASDDDDGDGSGNMDHCAMGHDCEHICVSSGGSYRCQCRMGFVLNEDRKTCSLSHSQLIAGLDHCAMGHDCEHICVSSDGSYHCQCRVGFVLNEDRKTCSRKTLWTRLFS
ncbi:hypothetical protein NFI96_029584, partial [Prochilodus magdalenae]